MADGVSGASGTTVLHTFFRSSASYRVRIALNLKGLAYSQVSRNFRKDEQRSPEYLALNPQGLVPALEIDGHVLTQSLAICEYLNEVYPDPPLLPRDAAARAKVRAAAQVIACDLHPVQNLTVLQRLRENGLTEDAVTAWAKTTIEGGLKAFDALLPDQASAFCFGDVPGLADVFLVPQLVNARRFGAEIPGLHIPAIESRCLELEAFQRALPENQPDSV